jgi:hypothetical protein
MTPTNRRLIPLALAAPAVLIACTRGPESPNLGDLYSEAAMSHDLDRNPVIVIPGILGSHLVDSRTGRSVWGAFSGDYVDPENPDDANLAALPMHEGAHLHVLRDSVVSDGALDTVKVSLLGIPVELSAYMDILGALGVGGYRDEALGESGAIDYGDRHYTCFQFDYDWRRDISENAGLLHEFILEKRAYVQSEIESRHGVADHDVDFDIVAHSMGGLLTRYYLRYGTQDIHAGEPAPDISWAGASHVDRAILVGTPNAGSVLALDFLVDGKRFAPTLPLYEPALLGTFPAIYQLLPRQRHAAIVQAGDQTPIEDTLSPELWRHLGWGLADPDQIHVLRLLFPDVDTDEERRRIAVDHQRKCLRQARLFMEAIDRPADLPDGLEIYLIAGDAEPTASKVEVDMDTGDIRHIETGPGDGTVLRTSALMDERVGAEFTRGLISPVDWTHVTFLFSDHIGLTKNPEFTDNILFLLLEKPR